MPSSLSPELNPEGVITLGLDSGHQLLNSGSLVIAALLMFIAFLLILVYVLYKDAKETGRFLSEVQLRSLDTIHGMEKAITTNNELMRSLIK